MKELFEFAQSMASNLKESGAFSSVDQAAGVVSAASSFVSAFGEIAESFQRFEIEKGKLEQDGKKIEAEILDRIEQRKLKAQHIAFDFESKMAEYRQEEKRIEASHTETIRRLINEGNITLEQIHNEDAENQRNHERLMAQENHLHEERMLIIRSASELMKLAMQLSTDCRLIGYDVSEVVVYLGHAIQTLQSLSTLQAPVIQLIN